MVVLLDVKMPGMDGMQVMERLVHQTETDCKVIMMTAHGEIRSAVAAMKTGAFDYLQKPFDNDELLVSVARAVEMVNLRRRVRELQDQVQEAYEFENIVGISDRMKHIFALMRKYAATDGTVLVTGESGTGKELVVRAIHDKSNRNQGPFVVLNCGAIPPSLIESEFFGHEAGSFTDAKNRRIGKFEMADGGTLFLDEIGDLPLEAQVKLLRLIEQREVTRVGGNQPIPVDVRVMAATNQDLAEMVQQGSFRDDLYWRLNVLSLSLCPLRDRREDIPLLASHFLSKFATASAQGTPRIASEVIERLESYPWPGNVRELQNALYSAMAIADGEEIAIEDLPPHISSKTESSSTQAVTTGRKSLAEVVAETASEIERNAILAALEETSGNKEKAAELLGIGRKTLYRKLQQYRQS
jgi:DNA-binding NtrC family response regulator